MAYKLGTFNTSQATLGTVLRSFRDFDKIPSLTAKLVSDGPHIVSSVASAIES